MAKRQYIGIKEKVEKTILKYDLIENGDKIILGVSGGPDSMCMLNILKDLQNTNLKKLNYKIIVAHVNHMIRKEAIEDEKYVEDYCKKNNIEFYSKSIDIPKIVNTKKIGEEEAGRIARYEFFDELLEKTKANKIAIAHNKNDKVETVLMNELRGSGLSGLKGIEPRRGKYIRPLIEIEREEIEKYCEENKLEPRIDKTNFENIHTRNKLRNCLIPYIKKEFNPNIIETINRLSEIVTEQEKYIDEIVREKYEEINIKERINNSSIKKEEKNANKIDNIEKMSVKNDKKSEQEEERNKEIRENSENKKTEFEKCIILDLAKFNKQNKVIKSKLILYTITRLLNNSKGIEKVHIEDIIKLCNNNIGNKYLTPNKNIKILIKNKKIFFMANNE